MVEVLAPIPGQRHMLSTLDRSGDTKTIWDPSREDEVAAARATFDKLKARRYVIYRARDDGGKGEVMHAFDPHAASLIAVPAVVGG